MRVFLQVGLLQHLLKIQQPRFDQVIIHPAKQDHLRVPRLLRQPARDLDRFGDRGIRAQFVLSRTPHFSAYDEAGALEILERYSHLRIVEISLVGLLNGSGELSKIEALNLDHAGIFQGDVAVRLNGEGLIEFRSDSEADLDNVAGTQAVERMTLPSE